MRKRFFGEDTRLHLDFVVACTSRFVANGCHVVGHANDAQAFFV